MARHLTRLGVSVSVYFVYINNTMAQTEKKAKLNEQEATSVLWTGDNEMAIHLRVSCFRLQAKEEKITFE